MFFFCKGMVLFSFRQQRSLLKMKVSNLVLENYFNCVLANVTLIILQNIEKN